MNRSRPEVYILWLGLTLFPVTILKAQELITGKAHIVLVNGNHITGELFYSRPDSSFIIKPATGIMTRVPTNVIGSIDFIYNQHKPVPDNDRSKIYNNSSIGIAIGKSGQYAGSAGNITAETVIGINFKPWLQTGLGIGYDQYDLSLVVPCFISVSGDFLDNDFTPYYFLEAGTSTAWTYSSTDAYYYSPYNDAEGKLMIHFGFGYRMYIKKNMNFGFSIGYRLQHVVYRSDYAYEWIKSDITYRKVIFRLVMGF